MKQAPGLGNGRGFQSGPPRTTSFLGTDETGTWDLKSISYKLNRVEKSNYLLFPWGKLMKKVFHS